MEWFTRTGGVVFYGFIFCGSGQSLRLRRVPAKYPYFLFLYFLRLGIFFVQWLQDAENILILGVKKIFELLQLFLGELYPTVVAVSYCYEFS